MVKRHITVGPHPEATVVICGAGIVGCASAYFLAKLSDACRIILIDQNGVASGASGIRRAFLAPNWKQFFLQHRPVGWRRTSALHQRGYDLHSKLATELGLSSYAPVSTSRILNHRHASQEVQPPVWLDGSVAQLQLQGGDTAVVDPRELTERLLEASIARGVELWSGRVDDVISSGSTGSRRVTGVVLDGIQIQCDTVVMAMGSWSHSAQGWFPDVKLPFMTAQRTSAVLLNSNAHKIQPGAYFYQDPAGLELQLIAGPDNALHCTMVSSAQQQDGQVDSHTHMIVSSLHQILKPTSCSLHHVERRWHHTTADGLPIIGKVPGYARSAFIATGHGAWGCTWGPISGLAIAESILNDKVGCIKIDCFDPARFNK